MQTKTTTPGSLETSSEYDLLGRVTKTIDAKGQSSWMYYDDSGLLTKTTNAAGKSTTIGYDGSGFATSSTDPLGKITYTFFDDDGRGTKVVDPEGNTSGYEFDALGQVTKSTDASGSIFQTWFDDVGRVTKTTDGSSKSTTSTFDGMGRLLTQKDDAGNGTTSAYDSDGRKTLSTDGSGSSSTMGYDGLGLMTLLTDASGNATTFGYDATGRKTSATDHLGKTTSQGYDDAGRLTYSTDRLGRGTSRTYDDDGRLLTEKWYDISSTLVDTRSFTYDDNGAILTAGDSDGTYTFGYDSRGLVTTAAEPFGVSLTMGYDDAGRRTLVSDSFGGYETSVYDDAGRLSSRRYVNGSTNMAVSMGYDAAGRITSLLRKSGSSTVATTSTTYDGAGRVSSIVSKDASSATISSYSYTYDSVGQLSSKTENGATTSFGYDGGGQVTLDGSSTYSYDGSGNRTNAGYVTSDDNRLDSDGVWNYTYDDEGNLTEKVSSSLGYHWVYEYDHRNQMTSAKQYGATLSGPEPLLLSADYKYDVFGNRIEKSVDADGAGPGAAVAERYAIDWFNPKKVAAVGNENADIWASFTSGGSLTSRHLHGDVVDQVFVRMDSSGNPAWLLTDRLGSVRDVIDDSATIVDRVSFDAFGNILSETNASGRGLYAFTGRQFDDETGFQYNRARYYDPTTARWTTKDPIGFDAGDSNLYRYVNNKATGATDPSGLDRVFVNQGQVFWDPERAGKRPFKIGTMAAVNPQDPKADPRLAQLDPFFGGFVLRVPDLKMLAAMQTRSMDRIDVSFLIQSTEVALFAQNVRKELGVYACAQCHGSADGKFINLTGFRTHVDESMLDPRQRRMLEISSKVGPNFEEGWALIDHTGGGLIRGFFKRGYHLVTHPWEIVTGPIKLIHSLATDWNGTLRGITASLQTPEGIGGAIFDVVLAKQLKGMRNTTITTPAITISIPAGRTISAFGTIAEVRATFAIPSIAIPLNPAAIITGLVASAMAMTMPPSDDRPSDPAPPGGWPSSIPSAPQNAAQLLARDCVRDASAIQQRIGGEILYLDTPGTNLGTVRPPAGGVITGFPDAGGWFHHRAVLRNGRVYDAMTGEAGMSLAEYSRLFEDWNGLIRMVR